MSHTYVLSWDCYGLEACVNVSDIEKEKMWSILKDEDSTTKGRANTVNSIVNMMMLRARFNPQRNYEIYAIDTDDSISGDDLRELFEQDPQGSADLIRERGRKLYSDRAKQESIKIR